MFYHFMHIICLVVPPSFVVTATAAELTGRAAREQIGPDYCERVGPDYWGRSRLLVGRRLNKPEYPEHPKNSVKHQPSAARVGFPPLGSVAACCRFQVKLDLPP